MQSFYIYFFLFFSRLPCSVEYWLSSWCYLRQGPVCSSLLQPLECGEDMIRLSAHRHCLDHSERVCCCQISDSSLLFSSQLLSFRLFRGFQLLPFFCNRSHIWKCDAAIRPLQHCMWTKIYYDIYYDYIFL